MQADRHLNHRFSEIQLYLDFAVQELFRCLKTCQCAIFANGLFFTGIRFFSLSCICCQLSKDGFLCNLFDEFEPCYL